MSDSASPENQWGNWTMQFGIPIKQARYDIYKVGQIIKLLKMPCFPSPAVYLETAGPAALMALTSVVEPDLKELYKWGHGPSPGRKHGRSLLKDVKSIIAGNSALGPAFEDGAGKYLFNFLDFADEASFYVWFASIVEDGVFEWISMAHKKAGCTATPPYLKQASDPLYDVGGITPGGVGGTIWQGYVNGEFTIWGGDMIVPAGASWSAGGTMKCKPYLDQPDVDYQTVVINNTTGQKIMGSAPTSSGSTGNTSPMTFSGSQPPAAYDQQIIVGLTTTYPGAWEYVPQSGYCNMSWEYP